MFHLTGRDDFATYGHVSKCIDYIVCDAWVSDASIQKCYEPFQYRLKGDHRAMVVEFDMHLLFGNPTSTLATLAQREFSSKDAGSNRKHIQHKHQYLTQHHFDYRLAHLQETWDPALAEQLDGDFQCPSSGAAKSVRCKPHAPYVAKLAKLSKEKNVLKQVLSQHRTGIDLSSSIAHQVRDVNDFLLPATIPECQQRCRDAQEEILKLEKTPSHFESRNKHNSVETPSNVGTMKLPNQSNTALLLNEQGRCTKNSGTYEAFRKQESPD